MHGQYLLLSIRILSFALGGLTRASLQEPSRDLDDYGKLLFSGDLSAIQEDYNKRLQVHTSKDGGTEATSDHRDAVADELYSLHWGPTRVPIYGMLGLARIIRPTNKKSYLDIAKWLANTAYVPVDGRDLSGTLALSHAISTKPAYDPDFAQVLYDAGGDVSARNRYGGTAAHEICLIWTPDAFSRAKEALGWYLSHGGNIDIKDGDGMTVRAMVAGATRIGARGRLLQSLAAEEDKRRLKAGNAACSFCGREDAEKMACEAGCGKARYCATRPCRRGDKARHADICK